MELLASGRDCEVFLLDDGRVARAYTDGRPAEAEATLIRRLHALGYPVPEVFGWEGPRIVMARVAGPTLGEQLFAGEVTVAEAAATQADLQARLHALRWPGGEPLLHLDLHPLNVLVGPSGPVVIDWTNARPGPPGLDVAMSALILAGVALTGEVPEARDLLTAYAAVAPAPYADHLDEAAALRLSTPHTTADERRLMAQTVALAASP
ncbi:phosphotransferase [Nocardioides anomalus]|uniref:Phosphotransferase n=1 Tax=Nocardioides anomalus TaxID=2712223 RepID=A0A6G6WB06_9ACTN|nr:phosphotransferase [Nocardioides anomalus]QIG42333.1 phosphotransferase [Nocardioides anomalus]